MNSFLKYNIASFLWAIVILVLCLMPGRHLPHITIWQFDKIVHFGLYFCFSILLYYGWEKQESFLTLHERTLLKTILFAAVFGFSVEVMQELFTADRHFELLDALANIIGATAGSFLAKPLIKKLSL